MTHIKNGIKRRVPFTLRTRLLKLTHSLPKSYLTKPFGYYRVNILK